MKKTGLFKGISMILKLTFFSFLISLTLTACGGSGGNTASAPSAAPPAEVVPSVVVHVVIPEDTAKAALAVKDDVKSVTLTASWAGEGSPKSVNCSQTDNVSEWSCTLTGLPTDTLIAFAVSAKDINGVEIYKGNSEGTIQAGQALTVTVTVALNSAKAITAYSLANVSGTINETAKTIAVTMPFGTDVTALVASFTTTGVKAAIGAAVQTSGVTANDFTNPLIYTVTAADGSTANYTVTVTVAASSAKALTVYSLAGVAGIVDEGAKSIAVTVPFGTDITDSDATFLTTGVSVAVAGLYRQAGKRQMTLLIR